MSVTYYNLAIECESLNNYAAALKHAERSVATASFAYGADHSEVKDNQTLVDRLRRAQFCP